jgi:hypothetical protein
MTGQEVKSIPPFQLDFENSPSFKSEDKKSPWIMDYNILEQRGIRIPNDRRLFFTPTKQSYSKQVERIEMWKKMGKGEETWASKACLITLLDIEWKELDHEALVELLNTFVIKGSEIYFGRRNIMYVINKQIIANAFGVHQSGYVCQRSKGTSD